MANDVCSTDYSDSQRDSNTWGPYDDKEDFQISSENLAHSLRSGEEVTTDQGGENEQGRRRAQGKYRCSVCGSMHLKPAHLKQHMCTHSENRSFVCPVENCGRQYKRQDHLNRHSLSHKGNLFPCTWEGCDLSFNVNSNLLRHLRLHEKWGATLRGSRRGDAHLICPESGCGRAFKYPSLLRTHIENVHDSLSITQAVCMEPGCGEFFDSPSQLRMHAKVAHCFVFCETCGVSMMKKSLLAHARKHEVGQVLIQCPYSGCLHSYNKKSNLNIHIRAVHMSLKPYACSYAGCEMPFAYKDARDKHEQCSRHVKPVSVGDFEAEDFKFLKTRGGRKRLSLNCVDDLLPRKYRSQALE